MVVTGAVTVGCILYCAWVYRIARKAIFCAAAARGELWKVQHGLDSGFKATLYRSTPLWNAVYTGHQSVAKLLLMYGADANKSGPTGDTVLTRAAGSGHLPIVQLLIGYGATVNAIAPNGLTALMAAAIHGHFHVVRWLVAHGAGVNVSTPYRWPHALRKSWPHGEPYFNELLSMLAHQPDQERRPKPAHMLAILVAGILPAKRVNSHYDSYLLTPLLLAIIYEKLDIVKLLVAHGAPLNPLHPAVTAPLWLAQQLGMDEIATYLQAQGAQLRPEEDSGLSLLVKALQGKGEQPKVPQEATQQTADAAAAK